MFAADCPTKMAAFITCLASRVTDSTSFSISWWWPSKPRTGTVQNSWTGSKPYRGYPFGKNRLGPVTGIPVPSIIIYLLLKFFFQTPLLINQSMELGTSMYPIVCIYHFIMVIHPPTSYIICKYCNEIYLSNIANLSCCRIWLRHRWRCLTVCRVSLEVGQTRRASSGSVLPREGHFHGDVHGDLMAT